MFFRLCLMRWTKSAWRLTGCRTRCVFLRLHDEEFRWRRQENTPFSALGTHLFQLHVALHDPPLDLNARGAFCARLASMRLHDQGTAVQEGRHQGGDDGGDDLKLDLEDDEEATVAAREAALKSEAAAERAKQAEMDQVRKKLKVRCWAMATPLQAACHWGPH